MKRGKPFESGNTFGRGRPRGSRNKPPSLLQLLLEKYEEPLISRHIAASLQNDARSRVWCLERLRHIKSSKKVKLPPIRTLDDIAKAEDLILNAVANQTCTAADGIGLFAMLAQRRSTLVSVRSCREHRRDGDGAAGALRLEGRPPGIRGRRLHGVSTRGRQSALGERRDDGGGDREGNRALVVSGRG